MKACIIVDAQNDFCPGGALAVPGGDEIIPVINSIMPSFPFVAATMDWHPPGHVSFAETHPDREAFTTLEFEGLDQFLWPTHCVAGTEGAALHPGLDMVPVNLVLRKGTNKKLDSYSAFFENDKKTPTGLGGALRDVGVDTVYLCGLALDVCVYFTAVDARRLGFTTFLIEDACRGVNVPEGRLKETVEDMKLRGVRFIDSDEV